MFSSSVARLTRQLTHLNVAAIPRGAIIANGRSLTSLTGNTTTTTTTTTSRVAAATPHFISTRTMATDGNDGSSEKNTATDESSSSSSSSSTTTDATDATDASSTAKGPQPFLQHQEWVKFQQSIRVDGFQTGQVTAANVLKKSKGGKQARARRTRELERLQQMDPNYKGETAASASASAAGTSKFPAIRYSPEETQELLQLAFDTLPTRQGKRGTRNLKRQANRWKAVRGIRAKYKREIEAAHGRRMEKRHWKRQQTKAVKEAAPEICEVDANYQSTILKRWAATMTSTAVDTTTTTTTVGEGKVASAKE